MRSKSIREAASWGGGARRSPGEILLRGVYRSVNARQASILMGLLFRAASRLLSTLTRNSISTRLEKGTLLRAFIFLHQSENISLCIRAISQIPHTRNSHLRHRVLP